MSKMEFDFTIEQCRELLKGNREADDWYAGIQIMQLRFRDHMKFLLDMTDFHLIKIVPKDALLVYGFAKAFRFEGQKLSSLPIDKYDIKLNYVMTEKNIYSFL